MIDLTRLNWYILSPHFKMETIDSVHLTLRKNDWAVSLDLKDAYFHIAIQSKSRRYLRFHFMGRTYQFRALPFGLSPAPYVFARVVITVVKHCRQQGMRLHAYLDDWLQPSISQSLSFQQRDQLLQTVLSLGFVPNWDKSELIPSQTFCFLGARFDLEKGMIGPSLDRILRLQTLIRKMLASHSVSAREIHSLLGQKESLARLLPDGRAHTRSLQWHVKDRWSQASQSWDCHIALGPWFKLAVEQWLNRDFLFAMILLAQPQPDLYLFTDASLIGWGAHLGDLSASGRWSAQWSKEHINVLELRAVWLALKSFRQEISGCHVLLSTDNTTVAAYLNKGGGARSRTLSFMATKLLAWCARRQVSLTAKFLPGKLNVLADSLSRKGQIIHTEWPLHRGMLSQIFHFWEVPHIDLFATRLNNRLPVFCVASSRSLSLGSGCDVSVLGRNDSLCIFSHSPSPEGGSENGVRNLPGHSDSSVLGKSPLLSSSVVTAGCASDQASLAAGSFDPASFSVLSSETGNVQHAWLCCREVWRRQDFLRNLPRESVPREELPLSLSTITVGTLGWIGVSNGRWIPSIQL